MRVEWRHFNQLQSTQQIRSFFLFFSCFSFFSFTFFFSGRIETRVLHLYLESVSNSRQNMCLSFCLCLQHINLILLILRCGRMNQTDSLRGYTFLRLVVGDGKICTKLVLKMQALNGEHINTAYCKKIGKKFKKNLKEDHHHNFINFRYVWVIYKIYFFFMLRFCRN